MQNYIYIKQEDIIASSREVINDNFKTVLSCSSGSYFPAAGMRFIGMLCFRTDQLKLYELKDNLPTWILIADLTKTYVSMEYTESTYSKLGHKHTKSEITDFTHSHVGSQIAIATPTSLGVFMPRSNLTITSNGYLDAVLPANLTYTNPATPKDGDIKVAGKEISIYASKGWHVVFPTKYNNDAV